MLMTQWIGYYSGDSFADVEFQQESRVREAYLASSRSSPGCDLTPALKNVFINWVMKENFKID